MQKQNCFWVVKYFIIQVGNMALNPYRTLTEDEVRDICKSEVKAMLAKELPDYYTVKQELDNLKIGNTVILPVSYEHAMIMLRVATHYIDIHTKHDNL